MSEEVAIAIERELLRMRRLLEDIEFGLAQLEEVSAKSTPEEA